MPTDTPFASSEERIEFSQAADYLDNGTPELIPEDRVRRYESLGVMCREPGGLALTPIGRRECEAARHERFSGD